MLSCEEVASLATAFQEGSLSLAQWTQVRLHLLMCPHCREYLRQLELTRLVLALDAPGELPLSVREHLAEHFRRWSDALMELHGATGPAVEDPGA